MGARLQGARLQAPFRYQAAGCKVGLSTRLQDSGWVWGQGRVWALGCRMPGCKDSGTRLQGARLI